MRVNIFIALLLLCAGCANTTSKHPETVTETTSSNIISAVESQESQAELTPQAELASKDNATPTETTQPIDKNSLQTTEGNGSQLSDIPNHTNPSETADQSHTPQSTDTEQAETKQEPEPLAQANPNPEDVKKLHTSSDWFEPSSSKKWYKQTFKHANKTYLAEYFKLIQYPLPKHTYALIAPIKKEKNKISIQYYSYNDSAFEYSMTADGQENYWPASTVKLAACVMALLKMQEYGASSQAVVNYTNLEGQFEGTVEKLCRDAIIPSNNASYNRLMEIAGFDEINDHYLPEVFHFPKMILQRRYVRHHPDDSLRVSPEITFTEGDKTGTIPERRSSGKMREECPREANCTTLAELGEVVFRTVLHEELPKNRRLALPNNEIDRVREALKKAPSCIGNGVAAIMGKSAIVYNKGGKVIGDDRLEIAVVSSPDKKERYLIALSMPYYEGVERETNRLAMYLIEAMRERAN